MISTPVLKDERTRKVRDGCLRISENPASDPKTQAIMYAINIDLAKYRCRDEDEMAEIVDGLKGIGKESSEACCAGESRRVAWLSRSEGKGEKSKANCVQ